MIVEAIVEVDGTLDLDVMACYNNDLHNSLIPLTTPSNESGANSIVALLLWKALVLKLMFGFILENKLIISLK